MPRLSRPALALALLPLMAGPAMAQANPAGIVWSALSPGNDWTAQLIQSIFHVPGVAGATGGGAIGPEATVIGGMLGQLTGAVMVFMIAFLCYGLIQQSVAAAETGRVLGNRTNAWLPVRLAFTEDATRVMAILRGQYTAQAMRNGSVGAQDAQTQIAALGWSGAGAYYAELGRLNGLTLSLLSATPTVNPPNWQGLGRYLAADLAPLVHAVAEFQDRLNTYIATTDPLDQPAGSADLFSGATPTGDGVGLLEQVTRRLNISERVLKLFTTALAPTANNWADPFAALVKLGHGMVLIALTALGAAGLMASATASTAMVAWNLLTLNVSGAAATFSGHLVMNALGTPIFYGLMALLVPGLIIAFVLPMIPMLMWTMGILGWLILFCEAMVSVPLWAFAHMTFQGDGLHGRGLRGYGILFNLLLRPTLMLFGLLLSYFCFAAISRLIFMTFSIASGFALSAGWLVSNLLGVVVMLAMFVLAHTVALIACFRMIALFPQHVPTWLGLEAADRLDTHSLAQDAGLIGLGATLREIRTGATGGVSGLANGRAGQRALGGPAQEAESSQPSGGGMDRTVAIATEAAPPTKRES